MKPTKDVLGLYDRSDCKSRRLETPDPNVDDEFPHVYLDPKRKKMKRTTDDWVMVGLSVVAIVIWVVIRIMR